MQIGLRSQTLKGPRRLRAFFRARTSLERLVATHAGLRMNKWSHFFEIYDRHFARFRGRAVTLLEIGVSGGGSLELWRRYFGRKARIFGLDADPRCKKLERRGIRIWTGDQGDPALLNRIADETGPIDILIDDGSHRPHDQLTTFRVLFPRIREDGLYVCEDLCCSYWDEGFDGGVRKPGTHVEFLKGLIDELNGWFWREDPQSDGFTAQVHGMHFYPALAIIEKRRMTPPLITPVGRTEL